MEAKDALNRIRSDVGDLLQHGDQFVFIPALLQYLTDLELNVPAISQAARLQHESQLAAYRAGHEVQIEMFKSVLETAQTAVNTAILVSGGGTVALLAFLGNLYAKGHPASFAAGLVSSLAFFAFGVLSGAVAAGARYASQFSYGNRWRRSAIVFHICCIALIVLSYILFAAGVSAAYNAFAGGLYT